MTEDRCVCGHAGTSLLVRLLVSLLWLQPASVSCQMKCSERGLCPGKYLCCYDQHCCTLPERVAELAGAASGVVLLFGGMAFCCIQCCRTRRQYASQPAVRVPVTIPIPTPSPGGGGDHLTERSPLIGTQPVMYGSREGIIS